MDTRVKRILFPTDFSEPAREAGLYAKALAETFDAELHVLHVVPQVMAYSDGTSNWVLPPAESQEKLEAAEHLLLQKAIDTQWAEKHRVVYKTVMGFIVDEIIQYANNNQIDLIVAGTHGYSWLAHTLIGSVAEKLVRTANCPVLTVHPKGHQFVSDSSKSCSVATKSPS